MLRAELLPYFYAIVTINWTTRGIVDPRAIAWLQAIGAKNRRCLRGITVMRDISDRRASDRFSTVKRYFRKKTDIVIELGPVQATVRGGSYASEVCVVHFK